jgi:hypothetical protein
MMMMALDCSIVPQACFHEPAKKASLGLDKMGCQISVGPTWARSRFVPPLWHCCCLNGQFFFQNSRLHCRSITARYSKMEVKWNEEHY